MIDRNPVILLYVNLLFFGQRKLHPPSFYQQSIVHESCDKSVDPVLVGDGVIGGVDVGAEGVDMGRAV